MEHSDRHLALVCGSIGLIGCIGVIGADIGATEEAAAIVLLFLIGEMLEGVAAGRARKNIQGLRDLVPKTALLERDGETVKIPAAGLAVGSVILVRPGDRIAADGTIAEGASEIDEAPVTGESVPKRKAAGDTVFAGTVNTTGVLRIRVLAHSRGYLRSGRSGPRYRTMSQPAAEGAAAMNQPGNVSSVEGARVQ